MDNIQNISYKLKQIDKRLYIVGGFCRDYFLFKKGLSIQDAYLLKNIGDFQKQRQGGDIDLVTDATPDEMKGVLKVVGEVGKKYGTCILSEKTAEMHSSIPIEFEITTFRKDIGTINNRKPAKVIFTDSLEEDAKRRDFTCNAIYYDVEKQGFIDPTGGIEDIQNNIIRFVGKPEKRIGEDALRILRYVRFKYKYGFIDDSEISLQNISIIDVLTKWSYLLRNISVERIRGEFDKILLGNNNVEALQELKDIGFLKIFFPEVDILETVPGNKWHLEGNVWIHIKMCIEQLNLFFVPDCEGRDNMLEYNGERSDFHPSDKLILYYTLFLHDIAKYPTFTIDEKGEAHYYNHENEGAEMFQKDISTRLKFSNIEKKEIYWLIKNHIRLFLIPEMKKLKSRKLMMHPLFEKLLIVGEVDNLGRIPVKYDKLNEIKKIYAEFQKLLKTKIFFTGEDIMNKYPDLKGSEIGEQLECLNNQVLVRD